MFRFLSDSALVPQTSSFHFITLAFIAFFRFIIFSPLAFLLVYTSWCLSFSVRLASSHQGERILLFYRSIYLGSLWFYFYFIWIYVQSSWLRKALQYNVCLVCIRIQCSLLVSCLLVKHSMCFVAKPIFIICNRFWLYIKGEQNSVPQIIKQFISYCQKGSEKKRKT